MFTVAELPVFLRGKILEPRFITSGCWLWCGACDDAGYGNVKIAGVVRKAHVVVYELLRGPVPPDHELDHLCRVPPCVNPFHMEPVLHIVNVHRGHAMWLPGARQRAKTHCPRGHEYTPENTRHTPVGRWCRTCDRERHRATH